MGVGSLTTPGTIDTFALACSVHHFAHQKGQGNTYECNCDSTRQASEAKLSMKYPATSWLIYLLQPLWYHSITRSGALL